MGWNGSGVKTPNCKDKVEMLEKRSPHPLLWAAFVVGSIFLLALVIMYAFQSEGNMQCREDKLKAKISCNAPSSPSERIAKSNFAKRCEGANIKVPTTDHAEIIINARKEGRIIKWEHHGPQPVFTNAFESYISSILTAVPGERFLNIDLEDEFDVAFQESLSHPIAITPEDTEDIVAIKKAVIQARDDIRGQLSGGIRPRDIVMQARDELNKIADLRDQLQFEFNKELLNGTDPKEVLKFANEANNLLAEYDALPIDAPDDIDGAYEALESSKQAAIEEIDFATQREKKEKEKQHEN